MSEKPKRGTRHGSLHVECERSDDGETVTTFSPSGRERSQIHVPAADLPLYHLLVDLAGGDVPASMLAGLAIDCRDLVHVNETVQEIHRGSIDISTGGYGMSYCHSVRDAIAEHRDRDPVRLVAVGCSGSKHEEPDEMPAKDRYAGGYWTNKREFAEATGDDWRILSAEHAVLDPEQPIEHYEAHVTDLEGIPVHSDGRLPTGERAHTQLDQWALEVHNGLADWIDDVASGPDPRDVELTVLLGKSYEEPLRERAVFDRLRSRSSLSISFPFREVDGLTGIGKQRAWMSEQADAAGRSA